jgi:hypothetical protein
MAKVEMNSKVAPIPRLQEKVRRSSSVNASPMHFSWHSSSPRLVVTSYSPDFDPTTILHWKEEGFAVAYLAYDGDAKAYRNHLGHLADSLELGDKYAIVGTTLPMQCRER